MIWRGSVDMGGRRTRVLRLYCDAPRRAAECEVVHTFPASKNLSLKDWLRRHEWRTIHRGGTLYDHHCPACAQISRTSAGYMERLHGT